MIIKNLFVVVLIFNVFLLSAQSGELLKSEGEIPNEFITPSTSKYKDQVNDLGDTKEKKSVKKTKKRFLLESSFAVDDILQSGMVLFNDPASTYVNKVLKQLPIDEQLKEKQPRAYVLNSSAVNAFATDQGVIFVTLGLLANLENESQLAFILAHELIHVKHQHSKDKFVESKAIDKRNSRNNRNFEQLSVDPNLFKKSLYSRKLEEEADEEGLEIFLKSGYDPHKVTNVFTILHYAYLPFEDYSFDRNVLEDNHLSFPEKYWLEEVKPIAGMQENSEEDVESTHPSSFVRLEKLTNRIEQLKSTKKETFLVSQEDFMYVRNRARYQIPFLNLYSENFPEAIYTSYLVLRDRPNDFEIKKVIGKALYMQSKYYNYFKGNEKINDISSADIEGSSQEVYRFLEQLNQKETSVLALKYLWALYKINPEDEENKLFLVDMFNEFAINYKDLSSFSTNPDSKKEPFENKDNSSDANDEVKELSKVEKIHQRQDENKKEYLKFALIDEIKDDEFKDMFEKGKEVIAERKEKQNYYNSYEGVSEIGKINKEYKKNGVKLGVDKIVVVNPFYLSIDARKNEAVQYIRSEKQQIYFKSQIENLSEKSDLDISILDVNEMSNKDVNAFNDFVHVNHYLGQQLSHFDLSLTPSYHQKDINAIADKYGTKYFLWTGVISLREVNNGWKLVGLSLFFPYVLPFTLPYAIKPEYDMLYYAILFDVETGRRRIIKMDYFDKRDSNTLLKAHIYDVFHQIKSQEK